MATQKAGIDLDSPGEGLLPAEEWWVDRHEFLKEQGYLLRPRYRPGWKPSYYKRYENDFAFEDGHYLLVWSSLSSILYIISLPTRITE
jgi:hypothetical protein